MRPDLVGGAVFILVGVWFRFRLGCGFHFGWGCGFHFGVSVFHFDKVGGGAGAAGRAADGDPPIRHPIWRYAGKSHIMLTIILFAAGLACFALFFKSIDYFEKI